MVSETTLPSPYEKRLRLVQETLKTHSPIDETAAGELAVRVLDALNSIPEQIR